MPHKVVIVADPGIDGAFAIALALNDPNIECLGLAATAGNVPHEQVTRNIQILVDQFDPPRRPRIGSSPSVEYSTDGLVLHGPGGLGGLNPPCAELHHTLSSDKLLLELIRNHPKELTIINLGPLTVLARALDREPDLAGQVRRIVCIGGSIHEPGNATAASEFHFFCDPHSARKVMHCGAPITLIPLDAARKIVLAPTDLSKLLEPETPCRSFLRQLVAYGFRSTEGLYGIEGFHLKDVAGIVAVALPNALTTKPTVVDVETRGELTRGMTVIDNRWGCTAKPNVEMVASVDVAAIRGYLFENL
jgi:inosine-uridine nucleoside N-ribohydrolase